MRPTSESSRFHCRFCCYSPLVVDPRIRSLRVKIQVRSFRLVVRAGRCRERRGHYAAQDSPGLSHPGYFGGFMPTRAHSFSSTRFGSLRIRQGSPAVFGQRINGYGAPIRSSGLIWLASAPSERALQRFRCSPCSPSIKPVIACAHGRRRRSRSAPECSPLDVRRRAAGGDVRSPRRSRFQRTASRAVVHRARRREHR